MAEAPYTQAPTNHASGNVTGESTGTNNPNTQHATRIVNSNTALSSAARPDHLMQPLPQKRFRRFAKRPSRGTDLGKQGGHEHEDHVFGDLDLDDAKAWPK